MQSPPTIPPTHWTDAQKAALVQQIIAGGLSLQQACTAYGLSTDELKDWVRIFRRSARVALDQQLRSTFSIRGLDLDDLSRAELSGSLAEISIADLLQTIQLGRKDAHITVTSAETESHIWCDSGEIIDAQSGALGGEEAVYRILGLSTGSVVADFARPRRTRRITTSTPHLLLEALRINDERARLLRRIGDSDRVFSVVADVAVRTAVDLDEHELAVLSSFSGTRSLDSALAISGVPLTRALRIAIRLLEAGLLAPAPLDAPRQPAMSSRPSASFRAVSHTTRPERPPGWVLALGALVCSTLGAATAIAYADALAREHRETPPQHPDVAFGAVIGAPCPDGMVLISGGRFFMGSDSSHPALGWARPAHATTVNSFCLGTHEVSVQQYASCTRQGACDAAHVAASPDASVRSVAGAPSEGVHDEQCNTGKPGREQHPQNCVSYHQAARYCAAQGSRLPTEAEWEFAARGAENRLFPWGGAQPTADHVNACGTECLRWHREARLDAELHGLMYEEDDGYAGTAPVGSFPLGSTPDGVTDLIGNVFEWTAGGLYAYDRDQAETVDPVGPLQADSYVIRGGNFNSGIPEFSDPALRFAMHADAYSHGVGFRCAAAPRGAAAPSPSSAPSLERSRR